MCICENGNTNVFLNSEKYSCVSLQLDIVKTNGCCKELYSGAHLYNEDECYLSAHLNNEEL